MKTGRKQIDHRNTLTGKPVVGLSKMKDGRWRIIGTQTRFSEADEQRAIARFEELTGTADAKMEARWARSEKGREIQISRPRTWAWVAK